MTLRAVMASDADAIAALVRTQNQREGADEAGVPPPTALVRVAAGGAIDAAGWYDLAVSGRAIPRAFAAVSQALDGLLQAMIERAPGDRVLRIERVLRADTPSLPAETSEVYARHGLAFVYVELEMARDLAELAAPTQVDGVTIERWTEAYDGPLREAYNDAFSTRGFAGHSEAEWQEERFSAQDGFIPDASFVASSDNRIAGFTMCLRDGDEGWIDSAGVRPAWRGRGVVDALLPASMQAMRDAGMKRAVLRVNEDNPRAIAVYRRHGFAVRRKHVVWARKP